MSINFKINVKRKVIINGVEYGSPEELPPELRATYEKALAAKNSVDFSASLATVLKTNHTTKITVNGRTYDNLEAMPEDDRKLYTQAMGAVRAESAPDTDTGALPVTPIPATPLLREKPRDDRQPVNKKGCGFFLFAALAAGVSGLMVWLVKT